MAEDTKKIARLDFDIEKSLSSLDKIDLKLKTISESSEKYAKNIGLAINNGVDYKTIAKSIGLTENQLRQLTKTAQKEAIITREKREREEIKTTEVLKREHAKQEKSITTLYDKITNYANTYLIYQGFNALKKGIQETIDEMVKVEQQMVAIDRVMDVAGMNIDNFRDKLIQMASDYGNSFDNVADISLRLAQAGIKSEANLKLTQKTLLALNTAELNATQATDDMVAVMAQWGLMTGSATEQAENYGNIIDKINKVADNFPTTSADIMDALKKTSSAFNLAGASIDETIATIVAAEKASQRGGKVIGTALANIVQQIKAEKKLDLAEQLGLNFFKDAKKTEFKPIMEIFQEMSDRMAALKSQGKESSTEMQQLLELFTVFRRNIGASLLGEMEGGEESTYMKVYKTSLDSVGYSLQENAKYMATAKAAQEQFNVELLKLKTEVWDKGVEDVYRNMLSFGTDVVKNITDLIDKFGLLPTTVGAATLAFTALNKNFRASEWIKMGDAVKKVRVAFQESETGTIKYNKVLKGTSSIFQDYVKSTENGKVSLAGYTKYLINTKAETILLTAKTIILQAAISAGLTLAITALVKVIDDWIHADEKAIEKNNQLKQEAEDAANKLNEQVTSIQDLAKEYKDFSDSIKNSKDKNKLIDTDNVKKAYELQTKINTAIKDSGKQVELVTKENKKNGKEVDKVNTKYKDQLSLLRTIAFETKQEEARKLKTAMELAKANVKGVNIAGKTVGWDDSFSNQLARAGIEQNFGQKANLNSLKKSSGLVGEESNLLNSSNALTEVANQKGYFEYLNELTPEKQLRTLEEWSQKLEEAASKGQNVAEVSQYVNEKLKELKEQYKPLTDATEKYTNALSELYALSGQVDVFDTMLTSIKKVIQVLKDLKN